MIDKLDAAGYHIFVIRDETETEKLGFLLPDNAQKKPNTGEIISVGQLIEDKNVKKGRKAIFNRQAGFEIELFDTTITVLRADQILGCL
jgi:co-chaperonin GroES (HSP10)